jgi:hypothetical protein
LNILVERKKRTEERLGRMTEKKMVNMRKGVKGETELMEEAVLEF